MKSRLFAVSVLAVLVTAACGGGDVQSTTPSLDDVPETTMATPDSEPTTGPTDSTMGSDTTVAAGDLGSGSSDDELPELFESEVPVPDGSTLESVQTLGDTDVMVDFYVPGTPVEAGEAYKAQLETAGFEISNEGEATSSSGVPGIRYVAGNGTVEISVATSVDLYDPDQAVLKVSYTTDPA